MTDEIELISDGDGVAVIGEPTAVERFLSSAGVVSRDLELQTAPGADAQRRGRRRPGRVSSGGQRRSVGAADRAVCQGDEGQFADEGIHV